VCVAEGGREPPVQIKQGSANVDAVTGIYDQFIAIKTGNWVKRGVEPFHTRYLRYIHFEGLYPARFRAFLISAQ
jgi:hypothetical protein